MNPTLRRTARTISVVVLAAFALAVSFSALPEIINRTSSSGLGCTPIGSAGVISHVEPNSAASAAGLAVGDRVDFTRTSWRARLWLQEFMDPIPGQSISFAVTRGNLERTVTLAPRLERMDRIDQILSLLKRLTFLTFIAVGAALVLLRPSVMTWGFYFFGLGLSMGVGIDFFAMHLSTQGYLAVQAAILALLATTVSGFMVFAARFPSDSAIGWRRYVPALAAVVYVAIETVNLLETSSGLTGEPDPMLLSRLDSIQGWPIIIGYTLAFAFAVVNYYRGSVLERQKIKWFFAAMVVSYAGLLVLSVTAFTGWIVVPDWVWETAQIAIIALPLAVAYTVLRHQVLDLDFVLSRAAVYGILLVAIVIVFALLDWVLTNKLSANRVQVAIDIVLALLIGIAFGPMQRRLTNLVDSIFFRERHAARASAQRITGAIRRADSLESLYQLLVHDVASAFTLASAALFARSSDGGFVREASEGWGAGMIWHILPNDRFAQRAQDGQRPFEAHDIEVLDGALPGGAERPAITVPIMSEGRVLAIALYGSHQSGAALDPDEIRSIRTIVGDAALIYRPLDELAKQNGAAALERQLATERLAPAPQPA